MLRQRAPVEITTDFAFSGPVHPGTYEVSVVGGFSDVPGQEYLLNPALTISADTANLALIRPYVRHTPAMRVDMADFQIALSKLPADQREVLTLVGASGFSYEEAAEICGVAVGTIKSRLNRARGKLAALLSIGHVSDIGPDRTTLATTTSPRATGT